MGETAYKATAARESKRLIPWEKVIGIAVAAGVAYLVGTPLLMLLFSSVRSTRDRLPFEATGFTLGNFSQILGSEITYRLLGNTLGYAAGTVLVSLALAIGFAYLIERTNVPLRSFVLVLVLAPMALPPFVTGIAWVILANPTNGILNQLVKGLFGFQGDGPLNVYSIYGMILVTAVMLVPSAYIMISGTFTRMDPALEEASRLSGVGIWQTLRRITIPLLRPGIVGAAIYYTIVSIEIFEIPALLGIPSNTYVLSTWIYYLVRKPHQVPDYGLASGYGILVMVLAAVLILYYSRVTRQQGRFVTVTGKGYRTGLVDLQRWKYVILALALAYFLLTVVLPFAVLIWKSVVAPYAEFGLASLASANLNTYVKAISSSKMLDAVQNTAIIAVLTATVTMVLSVLTAWLSVRSGFSWGSWADRLTFVGQGVPSIVVALAIMFLYISLPLPIYATIWIIVIALSTRYLSYGARVTHAAYLQIHRELEEASWASGVSWWWTMIRVVIPLIWPAFFRGWLWMFVHAIRDTTIPLMLISVANATVTARLWFIWFDDGDLPYAAAIAVLLMLVSALFTYLVARQTLIRQGGSGL